MGRRDDSDWDDDRPRKPKNVFYGVMPAVAAVGVFLVFGTGFLVIQFPPPVALVSAGLFGLVAWWMAAKYERDSYTNRRR